ncbi:MAG TPA: HEAT repeat domain-containing protein [Candidatus Hypogeohydataceae bacterium YC38]
MQIASNAGVLEEAPDNTLLALELALKQGARVLKVDVRGTKDGELVLMREETIDLITNGKGEVGKLLSDELMLYDAGSWLHDSFEGEPIPFLREVLRFAKINGVKVILDVKEQGLESQIISLLEEMGMVKEVYLWGTLGNLREKEPSYLGPSLHFLSPEELTPANIKQAHFQHKEVITTLLGCDDREEIRKVAAKGPDILLVDFPAVAADVLNSEGMKEPKGRTKRRALIVKSHGDPEASYEIEKEEPPEGGGRIDLLDPIGTLYNLLVGAYEKKEKKEEQEEPGLVPTSKEVRSLSRALKEPNIKEKGLIGRGVRKVSKGLTEEEAEKSRMAALKMTTLYSETVIPPLLKALSYKRPATRANAAWALGLLGDVRALPALLKHLWDEDIEVRREVALALGRLKDPRAGEALQELLLKGTPVSESHGATPAARYGTTLGYQDAPSVRYDAARALGYIRYAPALGDLLRIMVQDPDWRVKGACAWALGRIGDGSAAPALGKFLTANAADPFASWARTQAAWALSKLGEDSSAALLDALKDNEEVTRRRASWALVRIGSPALPALYRALRDPKPQTRQRAALALGWIGDSKAVSSLLRSLYDEEPGVRQAVIWALGRIGDPRAKGLLDDLMKEDEDGKIKELAGEAILRISKK